MHNTNAVQSAEKTAQNKFKQGQAEHFRQSKLSSCTPEQTFFLSTVWYAVRRVAKHYEDPLSIVALL